MQKFINFEIKLDYGTVSERVYEKYAEFAELFDENIFQFEDSVEECLQAIFKDIDIRTQEQLVKKAMLAHKLLYTEKKDYSFMCMELILVVMTYVHNYKASNFEDTPIDVVSFGGMFRARGKESLRKIPSFQILSESVHFWEDLICMEQFYFRGIRCIKRAQSVVYTMR